MLELVRRIYSKLFPQMARNIWEDLETEVRRFVRVYETTLVGHVQCKM